MIEELDDEEALEAGANYRIRASGTYLTVNISRKEPLCGQSEEIVSRRQPAGGVDC